MLKRKVAGGANLLCAIVAWGVGLLVPVAGAQSPKPLGAWFALYDKLTFDNEFAWNSDRYVVTHYDGSVYEPFQIESLKSCSAVYLGPGVCRRKLSPSEIAALEGWVADGGALLMSPQAGQNIFGPKPPDWLGIRGWWSSREPEAFELQEGSHPLARDLSSLDRKGDQWQTTSGVVPSTGVSIIGGDKASILCLAEHGRGKVVFLDGSLVPKRPGVKQYQYILAMTPLATQVWRNLVEYLGIPKRSAIIAAWGTSRASQTPLSIWSRYQVETPVGARLYAPPYPLPSEELKSLHLDVGIGERSRHSIFVTSLKELSLSIKATNLENKQGQSIPGTNVRVYLQDEPVTDYPKASYWLVPIRGAVALKANQAYTFWLIVESGEAKPGEYEGTLEWREAGAKGGVIQRLPLHMKVWDVRYPGPEMLHCKMEHSWSAMPGGLWYEKLPSRKVPIKLGDKTLVETPLRDSELAGRYIKDLGELEVDVAQGFTVRFTAQTVKLRETGELLAEAIKKDSERFRNGNLPSLDFSGVFDEFFDHAIAAGMRSYGMNYILKEDDPLGVARMIYGDPKLPLESEQAQRIRTWYWGEYVKYIRERGMLDVCAKSMDEFGPDNVPEFIRNAGSIRMAGFKTETTSYGFDANKQAVIKIDPYLDRWLMKFYPKPPREIYREQGIPFDKNNEIWGTVAGSYWGQYLDYCRAAGWMSAQLRYDGLHIHGYQRWYWTDWEGCFVGPEGPMDSVAMTAYAQGVADGRYLAQLYRMVDCARLLGKATDIADTVERELETRILGPGEKCLLKTRLFPEATPHPWVMDTSPVTYELAKKGVLELTSRLKVALGAVPVWIHYAEFDLVRDGKVQMDMVGAEAAVKPISDAIQAMAGLKVTPSESPVPAAPAIIVGLLADQPVRTCVDQNLQKEITSFYPRAGEYAIRLLPKTNVSGARILIVGGNAAGLEKGVRNFVRLWSVENRW
jgi:hypothetical protein